MNCAFDYTPCGYLHKREGYFILIFQNGPRANTDNVGAPLRGRPTPAKNQFSSQQHGGRENFLFIFSAASESHRKYWLFPEPPWQRLL
jgi:hypothetical protein